MRTPNFPKSKEAVAEFIELKHSVNNLIEPIKAEREKIIVAKAIIFPLSFIAIYFSAMLQTNSGLFILHYCLLGMTIVFIFVNLIHEGAHGNVTRSKLVNNLCVHMLDIFGANSYMWKNRHIKLHHNFPNIVGWDSDIEKSSFVSFHPEERKIKNKGKFRFMILFLYPFFVFNWFLFRDFKDFFNKNRRINQLITIKPIEYVKLFLFKALFLFYTIFLPLFLTKFTIGVTSLATLCLLISAGLFGLAVLLPQHPNLHNEFSLVDEDMMVKENWLTHQLVSTNDVSINNWFTKYVMGNFNYHVVHHLFPNVSHVFAEEVTAEVKRFCEEKNHPYKSYPFKETIVSHFKLVLGKENDFEFNILEEDM